MELEKRNVIRRNKRNLILDSPVEPRNDTKTYSVNDAEQFPGKDNKKCQGKGTDKCLGIGDKKRTTNDIPDLRPEFCDYRDEGCDLADACLKCPFTACIYDEPGGTKRWMKESRNNEILRLYVQEAKTTEELAVKFGLSKRTVIRVLKATRVD